MIYQFVKCQVCLKLIQYYFQKHPISYKYIILGVGYLTRQRYDELGQRREELESEDISLRCCYDDAGVVWLYGLFNGHNGAETARFARDRIAAEILLGQLPITEMDQTAKEIIQ